MEIEISEDVKLNQKQLIDLKGFSYMLKPNLDFYEVKAQFLGEAEENKFNLKVTIFIFFSNNSNPLICWERSSSGKTQRSYNQ